MLSRFAPKKKLHPAGAMPLITRGQITVRKSRSREAPRARAPLAAPEPSPLLKNMDGNADFYMEETRTLNLCSLIQTALSVLTKAKAIHPAKYDGRQLAGPVVSCLLSIRSVGKRRA
jgi:hypothetical protein